MFTFLYRLSHPPPITTIGTVKVLYDPRLSQKGALLTASKAPRRERDPADFVDHLAVGEIVNPHALPMYRVEPSDKKRSREMKDPILTKVPGRIAVIYLCFSTNTRFVTTI